MNLDNVTVVIDKGIVSPEEVEYYIRKIQKTSANRSLKRITFRREATHLDLRYSFDGIPLERIRRISITDEYDNTKKVG